MSKQSCREALQRVFEYLDNELPPADAAEMKRHFEKCRSCFPALQYCQSFREAMHRAADCQGCAPKELKDRIAELLRS